MKITVLAGGVGGATFLAGVKAFLGWDPFGPAGPEHEITAIVNTGDDIRVHGLQVCPDLDSCLYTLSGQGDRQRGWGRSGETWTVSTELAGYGAEAPWFGLGDKDIATHLFRTALLASGLPLSAAMARLVDRWQPGVRLLPMTDDRVETHVTVRDPASSDSGSDDLDLVDLHFQEWWIRYQAKLPALAITPVGASVATPAPGVLDAITGADVVLVAPSNPVVSVGPILAVPGIADTLRDGPARVVGVAPLIGGLPVRGHADECLRAIGVEPTAVAIARHYRARSAGGLLDAYLVAPGDAEPVPGIEVVEAPLLMRDPAATAQMVARCLELAGA